MTVNGTIVRRVSARAAIGDVVTVALPHSTIRPPMAARRRAATQCCIEDESLLIVDKPAGVVVHPTHKHAAGTLMNALLFYARRLAGGLAAVDCRAPRQTHVGSRHRRENARRYTRRCSANGEPRAPMKDYLALVYGRVVPWAWRHRTPPSARSLGPTASRGVGDAWRAQPDAVRANRGGSGAARSGCRCSAVAWSPGARTRFACISPRGDGRLSATRSTDSRSGGRSWTRSLRRRCGIFRGRRCMRGGSS